jgi:hypothetical protein
MLKLLKVLKTFCKNSCATFGAMVLFSAWRP